MAPPGTKQECLKTLYIERSQESDKKSLHDSKSWIFSFLSASNSGKFTAREFSLGRLASGLLQPCCLLLCFAFLRAQFNPGKLYSTFVHGFAYQLEISLTLLPSIAAAKGELQRTAVH